MATTGELRAIIADLELVDEGDAASYLGEEDMAAESLDAEAQTETPVLAEAHSSSCMSMLCNCISCR
jgi:hypothetical protein